MTLAATDPAQTQQSQIHRLLLYRACIGALFPSPRNGVTRLKLHEGPPEFHLQVVNLTQFLLELLPVPTFQSVIPFFLQLTY